jgi:hypothetical protein
MQFGHVNYNHLSIILLLEIKLIAYIYIISILMTWLLKIPKHMIKVYAKLYGKIIKKY